MAKVAKLMKNLTIVFGCGYKDPVIKKKKKKTLHLLGVSMVSECLL